MKEGSEDSAQLKQDTFVYSCDPVFDADDAGKVAKPGKHCCAAVLVSSLSFFYFVVMKMAIYLTQ